ncbi:MAG TPA: hypothetical protein VGI54_04815, partial [Solirubrobacteraceae bacterium]
MASRALAWGAAWLALALGHSRAPGVPGGLPQWLAAPTARWDAIHFATLVRHGYPAHGAPDWAFLPGFPLAARAAGWLLGSMWAGGVAVSLVSFAGALALLSRLVALECDAATARRAVWLT